MKIAGGVESVFTGSAQEVPLGTSSTSFSLLLSLSLISLSLSLFSISILYLWCNNVRGLFALRYAL